MKNIYPEQFLKIFKKLISLEGGYNNYKEDAGGETYKGIARNYNNDWEGWKLIDEYKKKINFDLKYNHIYTEIEAGNKNKNDLRKLFKELDKLLENDENLQNLVKQFYYEKYWNKMKLNEISELYPQLADKLFTLAVNTGTYKTGIKYLQRALNYLNRNGKEFPDLVVDGLIGPKTLNAVKHLIKTGYKEDILTVIKLLQGRHYLNLMDKNPEYKEFRGWFRRVQCK